MFSGAPAVGADRARPALSPSGRATPCRATCAASPPIRSSATALMGAGKAALDARRRPGRAHLLRPRRGAAAGGRPDQDVDRHRSGPAPAAAAGAQILRDAAELGVPVADFAARPRPRPRHARQSARGAARLSARAPRGRDPETITAGSLCRWRSAASASRRCSCSRTSCWSAIRAAERTRALVLALTGDTAGADPRRPGRHARPAGRARWRRSWRGCRPCRRPSGRWPSISAISPATAARRALDLCGQCFASAVTDAGRPTRPALLARRQVAPEPASTAPRRRARMPRRSAAHRRASARHRGPPPADGPRAPAGGNPAWAWSRGLEPARGPPAELARAVEAAPARTEAPRETVTGRSPASRSRAAAAARAGRRRRSRRGRSRSRPRADRRGRAARAAAAGRSVPAGSRLADLSAAIATVDDPQAAPARLRQAEAGGARRRRRDGRSRRRRSPSRRRRPSRAGSGCRSPAARRRRRCRANLPGSRRRRRSCSAAGRPGRRRLNATNRLLVGPFAGAKEAQAFVNQLKAGDLSAFAWTSAAGQKIEKLPAK